MGKGKGPMKGYNHQKFREHFDGIKGFGSRKNDQLQSDRVADEITRLRNELAEANGQTQWQCVCGGTDCAGIKENEELRKENEELREQIRKLKTELKHE